MRVSTYLAALATAACASAKVWGNSTTAGSVTFDNNRRLLFDTDGNQIDAIGAKINEFGGRYYLYGNSVSQKDAFYGIKSYSSNDLLNWQYEGYLFDIDDGKNPCTGSGGCGRPHIIYNQNASTYILWANAGSVGYQVATSDSPTGPFVFESSPAMIDPQFDGLQPADHAVEIIDGKGYLVFSALNFRDPRAGSLFPQVYQTLHISELTDDFLNTTGVSYPVASNATAELDFVDQQAESPDIFKRGDYFYIGGSNTCGYCNGTLALLYRSESIQGPWTRQILAGYGCNSQFEGVTPLVDPTAGETTYLWSGTSVPGGDPRVGFSGHIYQPLVFNTDGSVQDLDCSVDAEFTVAFPKGNSTTATGNATEAGDASPALAVYSPVCDSDFFTLYQTWPASQDGTIESVSLNVARGHQEAALSLTLFKFSSHEDLLTPGYKWTQLGTASFFANQTTWVFDTVTVPVSTNGTVSKGEFLGVSIAGFDVSPWCHLEYDGADEDYILYAQGGGQYSLRGAQGKTSPVYQRVGKSVKFFATYA
ncbi:Arabinanase/levansucrase/invertase [Aureobasidium pullulans]|uniref:Arabinanase/levansucrase/invertase n=1 Tax=Aureobasidium pullulans TaxID=5580 RepID=A0A4S9D4X6_AURPU|nr:Arabinanase/levansucrase/invertase [Aureobasidium pullulans]